MVEEYEEDSIGRRGAMYVPEEGAHWYYPDGTPCHHVPMKTRPGEMRPTTVRDARELGLLASVTVMLRMTRKPALEAYLINQHIMAAMTLPHLENESSDDFIRRVLRDAKQHAEKAADFGTRMHEYFEYMLGAGEHPDLNMSDIPIMNGIDAWFELRQPKVEFVEKNLASIDLGIGGRLDCVAEVTDYGRVLIDWKSQEGKVDKKADSGLRFNHYPENAMQGAAYGRLLGEPNLPTLIVYVDSKYPGHIEEVLYTNENAPWRWPAFQACQYLWRTIGPGKALDKVA